MKKKTVAGVALSAALGTPIALGAMASADSPQQPAQAKTQVEAQADLIECPLTGEQIPPCCCPERKAAQAK
ncbi:MAG: hypothetical protein D6731_03670 [Planctomycetota bacterium]|nr:MAG: hypothetical protein D6731_03670 [Planctomycetota bacterium]